MTIQNVLWKIIERTWIVQRTLDSTARESSGHNEIKGEKVFGY